MNYLQQQILFFQSLWKDFVDAQCLQLAASLSYTTLLSIVPLMAVSVGILMAFPVFETLNDKLQEFIFANFVPNSGTVIQDYLSSFTDKARQLTLTGIVFLLLTALMMISTIETGLNSIWRASSDRSVLERFVMYWAVLTLGPIMMGGGLIVTSYIMSVPLLSQTANTIEASLGFLKLIPLFLEIFSFTLLYWLVPNVRVQFRYAIIGGVFATLLFEIAKQGFAWYTRTFPTYQTVYGALAAIPIFLVWLYLSWLVTLLGAQLTYTLERHARGWLHKHKHDEHYQLLPTLHCLKSLWKAQQSGEILSLQSISDQSGISEATTARLLEHLFQHQLVARDDNNHWLLSRDLDDLSIWDLYTMNRWNWSNADITYGDDPLSLALKPYLIAMNQQLQQQLSISLADLFNTSTAEQPMLLA
ncbi:MAG: virulence factor BrkB family protein [Methylococcales bacterium]